MNQDQIQKLNEKVTKAIGGKLNIGPNIFWILPNVGNIQFDEWTPATDIRDAIYAAEKAGLFDFSEKNGNDSNLFRLERDWDGWDATLIADNYINAAGETGPIAICNLILRLKVKK